MADSEHSRSLPRVTRRAVMTGAAAVAPSLATAPVIPTYEAADPALAAWRAWWDAHERVAALGGEQRRLEGLAIKALKKAPKEETAKLTFAYLHAREAECEAMAIEEELVELLQFAPASSLAGIAAKLDAILKYQWEEDCLEFPFPQIRSALADLVRLGGLPPPSTWAGTS